MPGPLLLDPELAGLASCAGLAAGEGGGPWPDSLRVFGLEAPGAGSRGREIFREDLAPAGVPSWAQCWKRSARAEQPERFARSAPAR